MELDQAHKCLPSFHLPLLQIGFLDGMQAQDCNRQVQEMFHKAYFSPRAAQGAEREISRNLEYLACSLVRIAKESDGCSCWK